MRASSSRRVGVSIALAIVAAAAWAVRARTAPPAPARMSVLRTLGPGSNDARFARALAPRTFRFPDDHGPHPEFRNEWWYWTGNLEGPGGRRFGYQFTVFRSALAPDSDAARESAWATTQIYMAHFALTDVAANAFHSFERTSRGALDLAGATAAPFAVRVLDWSVAATDAASTFPARLVARDDSVAIDLRLEQGKSVVLHGDRGLSPKGSEPGDASYYDSLTRMPTAGAISIDGARWEVHGESWMDREWSTSALEPDQVGWDWLALQLDDGREIMVFRLRRKDGTDDQMSAGTLVDRDGAAHHVAASDFSLRAVGSWKSPRRAVREPAASGEHHLGRTRSARP